MICFAHTINCCEGCEVMGGGWIDISEDPHQLRFNQRELVSAEAWVEALVPRVPLALSTRTSSHRSWELAGKHEITARHLCFQLIGDLEQLLDELAHFAVVYRLAVGWLKSDAVVGRPRTTPLL